MDSAGPDLLHALWRYRRSVVALTLAVCAASAAVGLLLAPRATAHASLALTAPSSINVLAPGLQSDAAMARYTSQRALFVRSDQVIKDAAGRVGGTSVSQLRAAVTATPATTSTSIALQVSGSSRGQAIARANSVLAAYGAQTSKQVAARTSASLAAIETNAARVRPTLTGPSAAASQSAAAALADLTRQSNALQADSASFADGVDFVQEATPGGATAAPLPYREAALGALLGLALAGTLSWLRADRDRRITEPRQSEALLGAPLLGRIPRLAQPTATAAGRTEITGYCRDILAPLLGTRAHDVILVTSAERQAGCTTAALGFAAAAAAESLRVLIIDGDPAVRGLSALLDLPAQSPGLGEASLGDGSDISSFYRDVEVGVGLKIAALSAGGLPTGDWTVTAAGLRRLLDRVRTTFDVVVIDAPIPGTEYVSSVLLGMVDTVIVTVRRNSRAAALTELRQRFTLTDTPLLGSVATFEPAGSRR